MIVKGFKNYINFKKQYNTNVNIQTKISNTSLHHYKIQSYHYNDDIENDIKTLWNHHADIVNYTKKYGETPIYNAHR